jgi:hypothetical protein
VVLWKTEQREHWGMERSRPTTEDRSENESKHGCWTLGIVSNVLVMSSAAIVASGSLDQAITKLVPVVFLYSQSVYKMTHALSLLQAIDWSRRFDLAGPFCDP